MQLAEIPHPELQIFFVLTDTCLGRIEADKVIPGPEIHCIKTAQGLAAGADTAYMAHCVAVKKVISYTFRHPRFSAMSAPYGIPDACITVSRHDILLHDKRFANGF